MPQTRKRTREQQPQPDEPSAKASAAASIVKITKRFSGTINLYKKWGARPPMLGKKAEIIKEEFESGLVESQDALDKIADKVRTYGFSGSMGGPGSRREFKHPLVEAAKKKGINFARDALLFVVWADRVREPALAVESSLSGKPRLTVKRVDAGRDSSSIDTKSSQKWVSFAAAVVSRPAAGGSWEFKL